MKPQKLIKRFRREVLAHPKKAALLAGLFVVALYFWFPLVREWVAGNPEKQAAQVVAANPSQAREAAPSSRTAAAVSRLPWHIVAARLDSIALAQPVLPLPGDSNPFEPPKLANALAMAEEPATPPVETTPADLGLALTSTIIGTHDRVARINGRTYRQGQAIEVEKDGRTYDLRLADVRPRSVVVILEGRRYELLLPRPGSTEDIELTRSAQ
ncbi:MAG: hypothetical protein ACOY3P_01385 [Planctomycetota bacterium]